MQKIATRVFICASIAFGILGILMALTAPDVDADRTTFDMVLTRLMMITVFIILPSFALSIASKYLHSKSER
jgi:hypothetical protein